MPGRGAFAMLLFGALLAAPWPALATQGKEGDEKEIICVAVARLWYGTNEDTARISNVPVPKSYQDQFFGGACTRFSLVEEMLIDWHLSFGNEASTTAALSFLEENYTGGRPVMADVGSKLAAARRRAQPVVNAAIPALREGQSYDRVIHALAKRAAVKRLHELLTLRDNYVFLASQYARAAEFYGSRTLLARAESYFRPAIDGFRAVSEAAASDPSSHAWPHQFTLDNDNDRSSALEMQMAIVRAALSRDRKDIDAASAVLDTYNMPYYRVAAENAYEQGDDFCAVGHRSDHKEYAKACDEGNFDRRTITYLRYRAQLDLIATAPEYGHHNLSLLPDFANVRRIMIRGEERGAEPRGMRRYHGVGERLTTLHLARADAILRIARAAQQRFDMSERYRYFQMLEAALDELALAESLAPPSEAPGRFRQIATRFLDTYESGVAEEAQAKSDWYRFRSSEFDRKAAYFRAVLAELDNIATGAQRNIEKVASPLPLPL